MATQYKHSDESVEAQNASPVVSGQVIVQNSRVMIAKNDAPADTPFSAFVGGVHELPAASADSWTALATLYWDGSELTTTSTANTFIGIASGDKAATVTRAKVVLNKGGNP